MATRRLRAERAPVTIKVPFAAASVPEARRQLKSWMSSARFATDDIDDARVIVSELIANSIRHAKPLPDGTVSVTWCHEGGALRISVTDGGGATRPHPVEAPPSALAGRGLAIIETLTTTWWSERTRSRSTVYAVLSLP